MKTDKILLGIFGIGAASVLAIVGYCFLRDMEKKMENLKPAKTYLTRLNNDRILDMVMVDGNGEYSAHIGYPDGNYMPFAKHQELQLSEFDKRQEAARAQFITNQTREKEYVEQAIGSVRQTDVSGINLD